MVAIGLFGAAPAWAEQPSATQGVATDTATPAPTGPLGLSWRAVDDAGALQQGTTFEVGVAQDAAAAATGQLGTTTLVEDNAGQAGYTGPDLDPTPGAFALTEVVDGTDPSRTHSIVPGDQLRVRIAATASGTTPGSVWQTMAAPATPDDAIPLVPVAPVAGDPEPAADPPGDSEEPTAPEEAATPEDPATPQETDPEQPPAPEDTPAETPEPGSPSAPQAPRPSDAQNRATPTATVIVKTGGDRTGTTGVAGLAGVTLLLNTDRGTWNSAPSGTRPDGVSGNGAGWARCVSDANGECAFRVPNSHFSTSMWVVQSENGAPAGWFTNQTVRTGGERNGAATPYQFRTPGSLTANRTYYSGSSFMTDLGGTTANSSGGVWQNSRENPAPIQSCGVDVALVLDLSGSVGNQITNLRTASNTFVDALVGTQSRMSLFSFSRSTPATSADRNYPVLSSVSTQAQANSFKQRYANWGSKDGTNWDRALGVVAQEAVQTNPYDITVVITDGNPTFYGPTLSGGRPSGPGNSTRAIELENGVFSANALKKTGSRVIAFGVGEGVTGANSALNLRAISGPRTNSGVNSDFFQTADYQAAGRTLRELALGNCESQLTVTKMVVPHTAPAGSIAGAEPAGAGWEFTASDAGAGATLPNPPVRVTADDNTGTVGFPLTFSGATQRADVTVTETQQPGYTLQPVQGQNAVCTNLVTGAPVTPSGNPTNGFRVSVPNGQTVNCTVYNRAPDQTASVRVDKVWRILDTSGAELGTYSLPGDAADLPDGLDGTLKVNTPRTAELTAQEWGDPRGGYVSGGTATIDESVAIDAALLPGCTLTSNQLTQRGNAKVTETLPATATLTPGENTFEITNTVTCASQLSLLKVVEDGTAEPGNWNLTAAPETGAPFTVPGANNRSARNTFAVTADRGYTLSEALADQNTPLAYLLDRVERCDPDPSAADGCTWERVDETQQVKVGLGQNAVYRFVNRPAPALEVPLTGGLSSDALGIAGASIAGLALLVGAASWSRRRRTETGA